MTAFLLGAATIILLALIFWRRSSAEFRRKSEQPKFQFLANLGIRPDTPSDSQSEDQPPSDSQPKGDHDEPQP